MTISKFDISLDRCSGINQLTMARCMVGGPAFTHCSVQKTEAYATTIVTGSLPEKTGLSQR